LAQGRTLCIILTGRGGERKTRNHIRHERKATHARNSARRKRGGNGDYNQGKRQKKTINRKSWKESRERKYVRRERSHGTKREGNLAPGNLEKECGKEREVNHGEAKTNHLQVGSAGRSNVGPKVEKR